MFINYLSNNFPINFASKTWINPDVFKAFNSNFWRFDRSVVTPLDTCLLFISWYLLSYLLIFFCYISWYILWFLLLSLLISVVISLNIYFYSSWDLLLYLLISVVVSLDICSYISWDLLLYLLISPVISLNICLTSLEIYCHISWYVLYLDNTEPCKKNDTAAKGQTKPCHALQYYSM